MITLLQVVVLATIAFHVYSAATTMDSIYDWLSGVTYQGHFAATVMDCVRLAYQRGCFDGFVAGTLLVLILKRDKGRG